MCANGPEPAWVRSSYSNGNGGNNCVEVADFGAVVGVRDSKQLDGPQLLFATDAFQWWLAAVKAGGYDR